MEAQSKYEKEFAEDFPLNDNFLSKKDNCEPIDTLSQLCDNNEF